MISEGDGIILKNPVHEGLGVLKLRSSNLSGEAEGEVLAKLFELSANAKGMLAARVSTRLEELVAIRRPICPSTATGQSDGLVHDGKRGERAVGNGIGVACQAVWITWQIVETRFE